MTSPEKAVEIIREFGKAIDYSYGVDPHTDVHTPWLALFRELVGRDPTDPEIYYSGYDSPEVA
ncbi:hypothetical protein LCGC14_1434310, partial [marine sediment metagenome]